MATTNKKERKTVRRELFPEGTKQVWKASKMYSWGAGWRLVGKCETLTDQNVSLRLDVKNPTKHTPLVGEEWEVTVRGWRHIEGDVDPQGRSIVYVEGFLEQKIVRNEKRFEQPRKSEAVKKTTVPSAAVKKTETDMTTDVLVFRDMKDLSQVLYMEATLVNGKVTKKRLKKVGTLETYLTNRANNLRELINGLLENPYKGARKTTGVIEKYCRCPLEEIVTLPPFLTS